MDKRYPKFGKGSLLGVVSNCSLLVFEREVPFGCNQAGLVSNPTELTRLIFELRDDHSLLVRQSSWIYAESDSFFSFQNLIGKHRG